MNKLGMLSLVLASACTSDPAQPVYAVTIHGTLKNGDPAVSGPLHDAAAQGGQASAQKAGDVGHMALVGVQDPTDFLAIDVWTNLDGPSTFYANPDLQASFGQLLAGPPEITIYEQVPWATWGSFAERSRRPLYVFHVAGTLADGAQAQHDEAAKTAEPMAKSLGDVAHLPLTQIEDGHAFLALDLWSSLDGTDQFYGELGPALSGVFTGPPAVSPYAATDWYQW